MTIVEAASSEARILTATFLPSESCSASYTAAMPPRPISRATRYLPTRSVPTGIFDSLEDIEGLAVFPRRHAGSTARKMLRRFAEKRKVFLSILGLARTGGVQGQGRGLSGAGRRRQARAARSHRGN